MKQIKNVEFLSVEIGFNCPIEIYEYDFGSLNLSVEDRNFTLDVVKSYLDYSKTGVTCELAVDLETFPEGGDYKYNLQAEDLYFTDLKATLYIGQEYTEQPEIITLFVRLGDKTIKAIDVEIE